jgi:hypothetical protein
MKDITSKHDNFLADTIKPRGRRLGYLDGFRFGFGFFIAGLLIAVILAGLTWALIVAFKLH